MKGTQNFLRKRKSGYGRIERPLSLLIILCLVGLIVIGAINKYFAKIEVQEDIELAKNDLQAAVTIHDAQEEIKEVKKQNE